MKNMFWAAILGMVVVCVIIGYDQAQTNKKAKQARAVKETAAQSDSEYYRGFMDGLHATLGHLKFNTNQGKFELDIIDVLKDMKLSSQTNGTPTNSSNHTGFDMKKATNFQPNP